MATKKNGTSESSADAFARLGISRMNKAIKQVRTLRALGRYDHSAAQTKAIVSALNAEVEALNVALTNPKAAAAPDVFKF